MKLCECTADKLKSISRHKRIICFGAGGNLFFLFETYKMLELERRVAFIVDNDKNKIGTVVKINGCEIQIKSPEEIEKLDLKKYVIVITALRYQEIFSQIQNICGNKRGNCYKAPNKRYRITKLIESVMCRLPLRDIIILNGEGDTDENAQALGKYIAQNDYFSKYQLVWLCDNPEKFEDKPKEHYLNRRTAMLANSISEVIKYYYYMCRAKYIVFENQMIKKLRSEQISIYLNHGSPPIKATKGIIDLPADLNYAISPSRFSTQIIESQYSINIQRIIECGSPRTDILFADSVDNHLKKQLKIETYKKVILWVPTFRQRKNTNRVDTNKQYNYGIPLINSEKDIDRLISILKEKNILIIMKPHLLQDMSFIKIKASEYFCILTSDLLNEYETNIYDVMKLSDAMITDYSTIAFDFMLLNRPIGYTVDDINEYKLGFSIDNVFELMPGNKMEEIEDLIKFVQDISVSKDEYQVEREKVNLLVHDYIDGKNSERLCKKLGWREINE